MTGGSVISLASVFISTLSKRGSHPSLRIAAWAAFAAFGTGYFTLQSLGSEMQTPPNTPVQPNPIQPSETFIRLVTTLQALQQRVNLLLTRNTALHEQVQNLQGEVARLSRPLTPIASSSSAPPRAPLANTSLDESIRAIQERFQGINDTVQNLRQRLPQLQDTMTILETSFQQEYQIEETLDQLTSQPLPASQSVLTLSEGDEAILERLGLLDTIQRELREFANLIGTISTADEEINRQLAALQAQLLRR
jgi:DNA repair exonuclease SbcCD ATPase subunit